MLGWLIRDLVPPTAYVEVRIHEKYSIPLALLAAVSVISDRLCYWFVVVLVLRAYWRVTRVNTSTVSVSVGRALRLPKMFCLVAWSIGYLGSIGSHCSSMQRRHSGAAEWSRSFRRSSQLNNAQKEPRPHDGGVTIAAPPW